MSRSAHEAVIGCSNEGGSRDVFGKDVCVPTSTPPTAPTPNPPTPSPTSSLQVSDVGNPCTSFFDDGKCDQCTGDCDNDSDCATGLRCAQRRMFSGVENVPGCSWGPNSDSILFGDHDYCKFVCTP